MHDSLGPQILLLQIRRQQKVRQEELDSFALHSGLSTENFTVLNVFDTPTFSPDIVKQFDAVFVGGASEASVLQPEAFPFIHPSMDLLKHCVDKQIPVFASCYGFQLAVIALGGEVIHQEYDFEMGSVPIQLTTAATEDPLFKDTPDNFLAISVHQQKALQAPQHCIELAFTEQCCHAFRCEGVPFWCFQFHPEVDKTTLIKRLTIFAERYTTDDAHLQTIFDQTQETPESNILLKKFVERVL